MQPAAPRDELVAGPQVQVIGVAEDDLARRRRSSCAMRQRLDGALRADRHEDRRLDDAVRRVQHARGARAPSVRASRSVKS